MCLALPGRIVDIEGDSLARSGRVDFSGIVKTVALACVPEARPGDWVLVHAGFAIAVVDAAEAARTLELLAEIAED
jgi:hydrogenase expression/formation protein HypC